MGRMIGPRKIGRYSNEFRVKAVRLTFMAGTQVQHVAAALDIHPFMLSRWRKDYREGRLMADRRVKKVVDVAVVSDVERVTRLENAALRRAGVIVSKHRVALLMRERGLRGRVVRVTRRQPGLHRFCVGVANQLRTVPTASAPNQQWAGDITYLKLGQRWLYLAVVLDLYSRKVVGLVAQRPADGGTDLAGAGGSLAASPSAARFDLSHRPGD